MNELLLFLIEPLARLKLPYLPLELPCHVPLALLLSNILNTLTFHHEILHLFFIHYALQVDYGLFKACFRINILLAVFSELFGIEPLWFIPEIIVFIVVVSILNLNMVVVYFPVFFPLGIVWAVSLPAIVHC